MESYEKLLAERLKRLHYAVEVLKNRTVPATPMPRPRRFYICENITWPHRRNENGVVWKSFNLEGKGSTSFDYYPDETSKQLCRLCGYQPRKILRMLRRIEAATAWCYTRAEGRKRAAEEILRQQASAVEALEAEVALQALE